MVTRTGSDLGTGSKHGSPVGQSLQETCTKFLALLGRLASDGYKLQGFLSKAR